MELTRPQTAFGSRTWNLDVMVEGHKTLQELLDGRVRLVNFMGLDLAGMPPDVRSYPLPDGRGGQGQTLYQPFVEPWLLHQPLTTSFMIFDVWPTHFTLTIKSCVQFDPQAVCQEISRIWGPLIDCHHWTLVRIVRKAAHRSPS
jgi:hypothetical protein